MAFEQGSSGGGVLGPKRGFLLAAKSEARFLNPRVKLSLGKKED